jgi:hypothetical protein
VIIILLVEYFPHALLDNELDGVVGREEGAEVVRDVLELLHSL